MTDNQENKLSMFIAVRDFINSYAAEMGTLPNFSDYSERFVAIIAQLLEIKTKQRTSREGITVSKSEVKNALINAAFEMSRKIGIYAKVTGNSTLKGEVDFSQSELRFATDSVLQDNCEIINDRANAHLEDLETYYVTETLVTAFETLLADFIAAMPKPKAARTNHKLATEQLKALFDEGESLLKDKIDALAELLRFTDINFYNAYRSARALNRDYGTRKLAVIVSVADAAGIPIGRVNANVEGSSMTKKTSDKGKFQIDLLPAGTYTFNFSKGGYKPAHTTVIVNDGETTKVNVVMERISETVSVPV